MSVCILKSNIGGEYRIEVKNSKTGEVRRPFGDEFKKNLITDIGLKTMSCSIVLNSSDSRSSLSSLGTYGLSSFAYSYSKIELGTNSSNLDRSNTGLGGPLGTRKYSSSTSPDHVANIDVSKIAPTSSGGDGSATMAIQHQFQAETSSVTYREAGVWLNANTIFPFLFSRFTFPDLVIDEYEFVRVEYRVTYLIPSIVSPISLSGGIFSNTPDMNVEGTLSLVGSGVGIFGSLNPNGSISALGSGIFPFMHSQYVDQYYQPYDYYYVRGRAILLSSGFSAPQPGSNLSATKITTSTSQNILLNMRSAASGTAVGEASGQPTADEIANRIYGMGFSFTFSPPNPTLSSSCGGILFKSYPENDTITTGWLWKFNNAQNMLNTKTMKIGIIQRLGAL